MIRVAYIVRGAKHCRASLKRALPTLIENGKTAQQVISFIGMPGWVILLASILGLYLGTPFIAAALFEIYHLTGIDWIYFAYGITKFASGYFMVWPLRWLVAIGVGLVIFLALFWRAYLQRKKEAMS